MENKVKLNFKKKRNITKKIGDQSFKIKPFISIDEKEYILDTICKSFNKRLKEDENIVAMITGIQADLDLLVCALCTNVDLSDINYDDIYNSDFISLVKENIINYDDIEKSCNNMINILKISNLLPDLNETLNDINFEELMKNKSSEEIEKFTNMIKDVNISKE